MTEHRAGPPRIATLDILRGIAVMGILAMNAPGFAMPEAAYYNPAAYGGAQGIDLAAWLFNFILFDGKMRGLFSLLFGASLLLIVEGAEAKGEDGAIVHYRRMAWLMLFGAVHFYLIWWGDILLHYALIGLVAFFFIRLGTTSLIVWILVLLAIDLFTMGGISQQAFELSAAAAQPGASDSKRELWEMLRVGFAPLAPDALAQDLALFRGSPSELLRHRWDEQAWLPLQFVFVSGPETLALMLMGMLGLRTGFLTGTWADGTYRRVAFACIVAGGAGFAILAAWMMRSSFDPAIVIAAALGGTVIFRLLMIIGYAALIIVLTRKGGALVSRIAAAGRMAFTNYLGTSIIMTTLLYGHGFALYGHFSRAGLWPLVIAIWAIMLLWSKPWLERYQYGPFEWLWRSLARGRLQPMRKAAAGT